jgi:hypothetical protein
MNDRKGITATTSMLLEKLLRLERPQITEQMRPLLETVESREIFFKYLLNPADHQENAIQNSYWISKLISEDITGANILNGIYDDPFISSLLCCFQQKKIQNQTNEQEQSEETKSENETTTSTTKETTSAWLPHVCVVLNALLREKTNDITRVLTKSTSSFLVHFTALCKFSDTPLVSGIIQDFICLPSPLPGQAPISCKPELRNILRQRLSEIDVWFMLVSMVASNDIPLGKSEAVAECFVTSLKRTAECGDGGVLAESLINSAGRIVNHLVTFSHSVLMKCQDKSLVAISVDQSMITRVELCITCLLSLLEWTIPSEVEAPSSAPYQSFGGTMVISQTNALHGAYQVGILKLIEMRTCIFDLLRIPLVSNQAIDGNFAIKHSGYITQSPFSLVRLNLVHILHKMISCGSKQDIKEQMSNTPPIMEEVPAVLWRLLGSWFCAYPHSSMYHNIFVNIFSLVLGSGSDVAIKGMIKRAKKKKKKSDVGFLSRIIRHYNDGNPNSSVRGHILRCLNIIRLRDQISPPSSYLCTYLNDLQEWREFLPLLEKVTLRTVSASPFDVPAKWGEVEKSKADYGIEHGSAWAKSLGFDSENLQVLDADEDESFTVVD